MKLNKVAAATGIFLSLAVAAPSVAFARHGADDRAGHVRHGGDDGARHR
jgi:hypothetical protein